MWRCSLPSEQNVSIVTTWDQNPPSASWKKGTTKEERVFVMGHRAKVDLDSDEDSLDRRACKKLVKQFCGTQKKPKRSRKSK